MTSLFRHFTSHTLTHTLSLSSVLFCILSFQLKCRREAAVILNTKPSAEPSSGKCDGEK